ncbi:hypothetical protein [Longispora urticae]
MGIEIALRDWGSMRCGCGEPAAHLPDLLARFVRARSVEEMEAVDVRAHVKPDGYLAEPAAPAVSVLLAALAEGVSPVARYEICRLLHGFLAAEGPTWGVSPDRDLEAECATATRCGLWLLYAEVLSGRDVDTASYAFEVLDLVEEDRRRLERLRAIAGHRLAPDLREPDVEK